MSELDESEAAKLCDQFCADLIDAARRLTRALDGIEDLANKGYVPNVFQIRLIDSASAELLFGSQRETGLKLLHKHEVN